MKRLYLFFIVAAPLFLPAQSPDTTGVLRRIDSLVGVNRAFIEQKKYDEAFVAIEAAEKLTLETFGANHTARAVCLFNRGRTFDFMERHDEAEPFYLNAIDVFEKTTPEDHPDYASCLFNLGKMYDDMKRYSDSENHYVKVVRIREKTLGKSHPRYTSSIKNLGALYLKMHLYEKAEPLCLEAAANERLNADLSPKPYAASLNNLSILYQNMYRYEKAEAYSSESRKLIEKTLGRSHQEYARIVYTQAKLCLQRGDYDKAEPLFLESLAVFEKTVGKSHPDYINCVNALATLYWNIGVFDKAESGYFEAKSYYENFGQTDDIEYAGTLVNLGLLYVTTQQYEQAETNLSAAKNLFENRLNIVDHPYYYNCLNDLANLYQKTEQLEKSEKLHLQTLALREKTYGAGSPTYAESLHQLANLYVDMGAYERAKSFYLQAKNIQEKTLERDHFHRLNTLVQLARLSALTGDNQAAQRYISEADAMTKRLLQHASMYLSEIEMMRYYRQFEDQIDLGFSIIQDSNSSEKWGEAFDNALFFKGFQLNSVHQFRRRLSQDPALSEKYEQFIAYRRRLANEYARPLADQQYIDRLEADAEAVEKEIKRADPNWETATRQTGWQEIQSALGPDEAVIEFVHFRGGNPLLTTDTRYAALVLLPDKAPEWVYLFEENQLSALLPAPSTPEAINRFYQNPDLYKLVWKPLESYLKNAHRIYYTPSGLLSQVALHALQDNDNQKLINKFDLRLFVSTRQLVAPQPPSTFRAGCEAYLFGGIHYNMDSTAIASSILEFTAQSDLRLSPYRGKGAKSAWPYLKWTEIEVSEISDLLTQAQARVKVRMGYAASEEAFHQAEKTGDAPVVLHLATHAFYSPEHPPAGVFKITEHPMMQSGIVLAGANQVWTGGRPLANMEDGILTAYEIGLCDLNGVELATLSACETGLGRAEGREGLYGLQRAFKIAGVRYVLASLWPVSDFQTEQLMTQFYTEWIREGVSVPEAFRLAQVKLSSLYPDTPFAWAGFVLME